MIRPRELTEAEIRAAHAECSTVTIMAEQLGISPRRLRKELRALGLAEPKRGLGGRRNSFGLTPEDLEAKIRNLLDTHGTVDGAARELGIGRAGLRHHMARFSIPSPRDLGVKPKRQRPEPKEGALRALVAEGETVARMALRLHVRETVITKALAQLGLGTVAEREAWRVQNGFAAAPAASQAPILDNDSGFIDAAAASLAATGGRYRELSDWAARHGMTHRQALQRWHQLRMGVQKRPERSDPPPAARGGWSGAQVQISWGAE